MSLPRRSPVHEKSSKELLPSSDASAPYAVSFLSQPILPGQIEQVGGIIFLGQQLLNCGKQLLDCGLGSVKYLYQHTVLVNNTREQTVITNAV